MGCGRIPGAVGVALRPGIVALRARSGDWGTDTVVSAKGSGAIASHVERKSRYLVTAKLDNKRADNLIERTIRVFRPIPRACRHTLTVDNGKEFARFARIESPTGLDVFFADPYAARQWRTNENTNGLLRQHFPKGTNFTFVSDEDPEAATRLLNHRPRKCLAFQTPHEVFMTARRGALAA